MLFVYSLCSIVSFFTAMLTFRSVLVSNMLFVYALYSIVCFCTNMLTFTPVLVSNMLFIYALCSMSVFSRVCLHVDNYWSLMCYMFMPYAQLSVFARLSAYIGPVHEISNNLVCATSKASDQPVHTRSLIRSFANRLSIL